MFSFKTRIITALGLIKDLVAGGHFRAVIDRKSTIEEIAVAYPYVPSSQKF